MIKTYMERRMNLDEYISRIEQNDQDLCVIDLESANLNNDDIERLMAKLTAAINVAPRIIKLCLNNNQLTSVNISAELTNLNELYLYDNHLTSINIPAELTNLHLLDLNDNQLTSINIPVELANLTHLWLGNNQLISINIPAELTNLNALSLSGNQLISINIPAELTNLEMLWVDDNQLTSINIPAELTNLHLLGLNDNQLTSINIPSELTNLNVLILANNQLTSINIPVELAKLTHLWLSGNQLISINIPAELTNLNALSVDDNQLTSINIPAELTNLKELYIGDNQLTMVTKIALTLLIATQKNLNIHDLGNDVMEQLSTEILEEYFEVIVNESLSEIKMALRSCAIKAAIKGSVEVITKLPEHLIYSIINFISCSDKLLNENVTMLRRMFAKNELQLNILNAFLNSPRMKTIRSAIYNAHNNEIAGHLKMYSLNSKKVLDMRNVSRKRELIVSGIAALTCKPSLKKEECLGRTIIDPEVNPFQITMRPKM
jgi:Leucine-rich repeat (LRR) protein